MTLWAEREGQQITLNGNTGVEVLVKNSQLSHVKITEHAQHVESFHAHLGKLLAEAKAEREDNA